MREGDQDVSPTRCLRKIHYEAINIKTVWHWKRNGEISATKQSPEIDPNIFENLAYY